MCSALRLLLAGLVLIPVQGTQAVTGSTFEVSATISAGCLVVGGVTTYGVLDFGTRSALATGVVGTSLGGTTVTFQCTPGLV